jgi:hypothetical protein
MGLHQGTPISAGNGRRRVHDVVHDAREDAGLWSRHWEQVVDPRFCGTSSARAPLWATWALRSVELERSLCFSLWAGDILSANVHVEADHWAVDDEAAGTELTAGREAGGVAARDLAQSC